MDDRAQLPLDDAPSGFADNLHCFVCGPKNPVGLRLAIEYDVSARTCRAEWTPRAEFQGWAGILHGGILASLLDEAMVNLAVLCGLQAVTAEMTFRLSRSARIGVPLAITGRIVGTRGRMVTAASEITDPDGRVAWAEGKLLRPKAASPPGAR